MLREALVTASKEVAEAGLTPGRSGNVSVRTRGGLLVTPSGLSLHSLRVTDLIALDEAGDATTPKPPGKIRTSEWRLHTDVYAARPDINAIVHTHSRFATVFGCLRRELRAVHYMIALAGTPSVKCAEYATYGTEALSKNALLAIGDGRACLLANHGLVALGVDLPSAVRLAIELENVAALEWHASAIGTPVILDAGEIANVGKKFASYGKVSD